MSDRFFSESWTVIKFLCVGVLNTVVGFSVMFLLYNLLHFGYWFSSAANYVIGGAVSFCLNKFFTFRNTENSIAQLLKFIIVLVLCYFVAYFVSRRIVYLLLVSNAESFKDNVAMFTGAVFYTTFNYICQRFFVFRNESEKKQGV